MLVHEILNTKITPLKSTDSVALAMTKMDLLNTTKFPVVDDGVLKGMIALETLIEVSDESHSIATIPLDDMIYLPKEQHLFEAAKRMLAYEIFVLPVVDSDMKFLGMVKKGDVLASLGNIFNLESFGSVITVEMTPYDFTLTEIVRLIETEGAKILGVAVQQPGDDQQFYRVSLKLNLEDSSPVTAALQRFGYVVTSQISSAAMENDFSERADELIRYLDI